MLHPKVPEYLQSVIKNLIPPKGICRKNIEGTELLDLTADEVVVEVQEQQQDDESASDIGKENSAEPELAAAIPLPIDTPEGITLLENLCDDSAINKDARFLDALSSVFDQNETSEIFLPRLKRMKSAFYQARINVKKRIRCKTEHKEQVEEENDDIGEQIEEDNDDNVFNILRNM